MPAEGTPPRPGMDAEPTIRREGPSAADATQPAPAGGGAEPTLIRSETAPTASPIRSRLASYELIDELGHGGMGIVYRARDTRLGREVALKVLIAGEHASAEALTRFQREAAVVARMGKHPHIVQVHEFGQDGPRHFFTMDLVEGRSLRAWLQETRTPRQILELAHKVALALAHAHAHGIVHRDLKPDNVLVDAHDEPQVTDFGLARDVAAPARLSVSGDLMGTPAYMAPEQATGRASLVGPWTDTWALGVMLYEALAGRLPFHAGDLASLLLAISRDEPVPLRRFTQHVSSEIDTIVAKCLEKAPEARYRDGAALAAELARWLAGEPIEARPTTFAYRAWKRIRRSPLISGLAAAVAVLALAVGGVAWAGRIRAATIEREAKDRQEASDRERARLVTTYVDSLRETGPAVVEAALSRRRAGDLEGMRGYVVVLEKPIRELKGLAPGLAEPWFHEGRLLRAFGENARAEASQDEAVRLAGLPSASEGSRALLPLARYERGVLRLQRYIAELEDRQDELLRRRAAARTGVPPAQATVRELLDAYPALEALVRSTLDDLSASAGSKAAGAEPEARSRFAAGAVVLLGGHLAPRTVDSSDFIRLWDEALARDPLLQEATMLRAQLAEVSDRLEEAAEWFDRGHQADQGFLPYLLGAARAFGERAREIDASGGDGAPTRAKGIERVEAALALDANDEEGWRRKSALLLDRAESAPSRGGDPAPDFNAADDAAQRAIALAPRSHRPHFVCGNALSARGDWQAGHGQDPREAYRSAIEAYERAEGIDPSDSLLLDNLAMTWLALGVDAARRGRAAQEAFDRAIEVCARALAVAPREAQIHVTAGSIHRQIGASKRERGEDPRPAFQEALARYEAALAIEPREETAAVNRAGALVDLGDDARDRGEDPRDLYGRAIDATRQALQINPRSADARSNEGVARASLARAGFQRGDDVREEFGRAAAALEGALALDPKRPRTAGDLANVKKQMGDFAAMRGEDPDPLYREAIEVFGKALALDPTDAATEFNRANTWIALGQSALARDEDPRATLEKALQGCARALALRPGFAAALGASGNVRILLGEDAVRRHEDPRKELEAALAALGKAADANPRSAEIVCNIGYVHEMIGVAADARGEDARPEFERSLEAYRRAAEINPGLLNAWRNQADVLLGLGQIASKRGEDARKTFEAAIEAAERALRLKPSDPESTEILRRAKEGKERIDPGK